MKILIVHNSYRQAGGEDSVVEVETRMLEQQGHHVSRYRRQNRDLESPGPIGWLCAGAQTVWSRNSYRQMAEMLAREKPDVAHFHNTFPLISPSAYYACAKAKVPVVQTLHNYRLLCPAATFLRDGRVCEECLSRSVPWPGVLHACYRENRLATAATVGMLAAHRAAGTWNRKIDVYLAPSEFARRKFIAGGFPEERIAVKPNFLHPDPGVESNSAGYALFAGRLSEEKGLRTLVSAWGRLRVPVPLLIAGDGPLRAQIETKLEANIRSRITFLGQLAPAQLLSTLRRAHFLVFPSLCFETFGMAAIESFACGVPVIASRLGAMGEIVEDDGTGLLFEPNNPEDLAAKIDWAWSHPEELRRMGKAARAEYEAKYTAEKNYGMLMGIYRRVIRGTC